MNKVKKKEKKAVLEAILFTMGEAVEVERLAEVIEEDNDKTRELLLEMHGENMMIFSWSY